LQNHTVLCASTDTNNAFIALLAMHNAFLKGYYF